MENNKKSKKRYYCAVCQKEFYFEQVFLVHYRQEHLKEKVKKIYV